jgi:hypothetical protein
MTENQTYTDWQYQPAPPAPKKRRAWIIPVIALALGLIIGGASTAGAKPEPVEVVKEVPGPERTVEKRVEVKVPTTPAACLNALTINEQAFTYLSESMDHILSADYAAANRSTERVKALVPKSNAAKAECRASAK